MVDIAEVGQRHFFDINFPPRRWERWLTQICSPHIPGRWCQCPPAADVWEMAPLFKAFFAALWETAQRIVETDRMVYGSRVAAPCRFRRPDGPCCQFPVSVEVIAQAAPKQETAVKQHPAPGFAR